MSFNWKSVVKTVAPLLGTALGGPFGGMAAKVVSNTLLGKEDGTDDEIFEALQSASPEKLLELKAADNTFKQEMAKVGLDEKKLAFDDADSARKRQMSTHDRTPDVLAYLLLTAFVGALMSLYNIEIPEANESMVHAMLGSLGTLTIAACAYFHGSSRGSAKKDDMIKSLG